MVDQYVTRAIQHACVLLRSDQSTYSRLKEINDSFDGKTTHQLHVSAHHLSR